MEIASETILAGKAKVMVAGGFDDLCEEGSYEFGNMKATSNSETELAMGREPTEMSRPTTTTRAGVCPLISLVELPSLNLMIVSLWSLKASAYTF
jgi:3-oxoacyl-(acyl-carrier-protein) synthase